MWTTLQNEEIQEQVLIECSTVLTKKLDVLEIVCHLNNEKLLTPSDNQFLESDVHDGKKAKYLITILPKKDKGWFNKFLFCLHQSSHGTGHQVIIAALKSKYQELTSQSRVTYRESSPCKVNVVWSSTRCMCLVHDYILMKGKDDWRY